MIGQLLAAAAIALTAALAFASSGCAVACAAGGLLAWACWAALGPKGPAPEERCRQRLEEFARREEERRRQKT